MPRKRRGSDTKPLYRALFCHFFELPAFKTLTPNARLVLLALRLSPVSTWAGIANVFREALQSYTGLSDQEVDAALKELEVKPTRRRSWIVRDGAIIWIRDAVKFDPNTSLDNAAHRLGIERVLATYPPSLRVIREFRSYYGLSQKDGGPPSPKDGESHAPRDRGTLPPREGESTTTTTTTTTTTKKENDDDERGANAAPQTPGGGSAARPPLTPEQSHERRKVEVLAGFAAKVGNPVDDLLEQGRRQRDEGVR